MKERGGGRVIFSPRLRESSPPPCFDDHIQLWSSCLLLLHPKRRPHNSFKTRTNSWCVEPQSCRYHEDHRLWPCEYPTNNASGFVRFAIRKVRREKAQVACLYLQFQLRHPLCDFLLLVDVNEWINNEQSECMFLYPSIRVWLTRSHPLKGENCTKYRSKSLQV